MYVYVFVYMCMYVLIIITHSVSKNPAEDIAVNSLRVVLKD